MVDTIASPVSAEPSGGAIAEEELCGVLVLDAGGRVVAANRSARQIWGAADKTLVGLSFTQLFALAATSANAAPTADWKSAHVALLDRTSGIVAVSLRGDRRPVRLRLERALGGAGSYIATLLPPK